MGSLCSVTTPVIPNNYNHLVESEPISFPPALGMGPTAQAPVPCPARNSVSLDLHSIDSVASTLSHIPPLPLRSSDCHSPEPRSRPLTLALTHAHFLFTTHPHLRLHLHTPPPPTCLIHLTPPPTCLICLNSTSDLLNLPLLLPFLARTDLTLTLPVLLLLLPLPLPLH